MNNLEKQSNNIEQKDPIVDKVESIKQKEFTNVPKDFFEVDNHPEIKTILSQISNLQKDFDTYKNSLTSKYTDYRKTRELFLNILKSISDKTTLRDSSKEAAINTTDTKTAQKTNVLTKELADLEKQKTAQEEKLNWVDSKWWLSAEISQLEEDMKQNNQEMIKQISLYKDKVLELSNGKVAEYETKIIEFIKNKLDPQKVKIWSQIDTKIDTISSNDNLVTDKISTEKWKITKENKQIDKTNKETEKLFIELEWLYSDYIWYAYAGQLARLNIYQFQSDIRKNIKDKYGALFDNIADTENFFKSQKNYFDDQKKSLLSKNGSIYTRLAKESLDKYNIYNTKLSDYEKETSIIKESKKEIGNIYDIVKWYHDNAKKDFDYQLHRGNQWYYDFVYNYYLNKSNHIASEIEKIFESSESDTTKDKKTELQKLEIDYKDKKISEDKYLEDKANIQEEIEKLENQKKTNLISLQNYKAKLEWSSNDRWIISIRRDRADKISGAAKTTTFKKLNLESWLNIAEITSDFKIINIKDNIQDPIKAEKDSYENIYNNINSLKTYISWKDDIKSPESQK